MLMNDQMIKFYLFSIKSSKICAGFAITIWCVTLKEYTSLIWPIRGSVRIRPYKKAFLSISGWSKSLLSSCFSCRSLSTSLIFQCTGYSCLLIPDCCLLCWCSCAHYIPYVVVSSHEEASFCNFCISSVPYNYCGRPSTMCTFCLMFFS